MQLSLTTLLWLLKISNHVFYINGINLLWRGCEKRIILKRGVWSHFL